MKAEHISIAHELEQIPNLGSKTANLLRSIGIVKPADLVNEEAYGLYDKICQITRKTHDLRLLDILLSATDFAQGGSPRHWSEYSAQRHRMLQNRTV